MTWTSPCGPAAPDPPPGPKAESRLTHLTSFEEFVARFTEPISIDAIRVQELLTELLSDSPTLVETAAANVLKEGRFDGTGIGSVSLGVPYGPVRWDGWLLPPSAVVRRIADASGHKIGEEEWYTASVDWILAGFAKPILPVQVPAANAPAIIQMACGWRTKLLFSTREGESPSVIEHGTPSELDLNERDEWQPLVAKAMESATSWEALVGALFLSMLVPGAGNDKGRSPDLSYTTGDSRVIIETKEWPPKGDETADGSHGSAV